MLVIMIQSFTCVMLIKVFDVGWDKIWDVSTFIAKSGRIQKLTGFYCRSVPVYLFMYMNTCNWEARLDKITSSSIPPVGKQTNMLDANIEWASTRQNVSSGVSDQARHKPACTATEASKGLEISAIESRDIIQSKKRTTKALIRLRGCAGWYAPLLFAYDIRHVYSWPGSDIFN